MIQQDRDRGAILRIEQRLDGTLAVRFRDRCLTGTAFAARPDGRPC
jgi:hypothetical protein